jgi:plastocyanin
MRWRKSLVGLSAGMLMAALAMALLLSTSTQTADAAEHRVDIRDFNFSPTTLTVQVGDVVRWTNGGAAAHTASSETGAFESGNLPPGGVFSHQFLTAGTFAYLCRIHTQMRGTIIVQGEATAVPPTAAPTQAPPPTAPPTLVLTGVPATAVPTASPAPTAVPASPTPPELWLLVLSPTAAWTLSDELAWVAAPGEWYRIYAQEAGWSLAVWEFDVPSNVVWIELDGRVEVSAF